MSEYSFQYIFTKSNSLVSYFGLILAFIGSILFTYTLIYHNSSNNLLVINIISVFSINVGILIWEISFFQRIRFFNILYSHYVFILFISIIPLWIAILSPYGLLLYDTVIFSNEISLITNQNLILVIKILAMLGDLLIFVDIVILVLFLFKE